MKTETLLIIGGLGVAAYLLYKQMSTAGATTQPGYYQPTSGSMADSTTTSPQVAGQGSGVNSAVSAANNLWNSLFGSGVQPNSSGVNGLNETNGTTDQNFTTSPSVTNDSATFSPTSTTSAGWAST